MKIETVETAYYRLPLEPMGDAGHGAIDTEELITLALGAEGLTGHGYAYTIGRGGRAVKALIDHDLAPLIEGQDASDIEGLWDLMWRRLLYVGRGGLASFAIAAVDVALWDLRGRARGDRCTRCWAPKPARSRPTAPAWICRSRSTACSPRRRASWKEASRGSRSRSGARISGKTRSASAPSASSSETTWT